MVENEPLRFGIIGTGGMGAGHLAAVQATHGMTLAAVCDTDSEALHKATSDIEAPGFHDFEEMIAQVPMDGLIAALPHHLHRDVVTAACKARIPLLKEKPLARNMTEALEFVEMAEDAGTLFMLATQRRYNSAYARMKQISEQLGHIFLARGQYCFRWSRDFAWRGQWETAGGGALHDMGYHTVDMLNWYLGLPDWVDAEWRSSGFPAMDYDTDDTAVTMFGYDSGAIGYLLTTWATTPAEETFYLHGTDGVARADQTGIVHMDTTGSVVSQEPGEGSSGIALRNQVAHFAQCIRTGAAPLTSARANLPNMAFIEAAYRSAAEETRVSPRDFLPE